MNLTSKAEVGKSILGWNQRSEERGESISGSFSLTPKPSYFSPSFPFPQVLCKITRLNLVILKVPPSCNFQQNLKETEREKKWAREEEAGLRCS